MDALRLARSAKRHLEDVDQKLRRAKNYSQYGAGYTSYIDSELKRAESELNSAVGDLSRVIRLLSQA